MRYTNADPENDYALWVEAVCGAVVTECNHLGWPLPRHYHPELALEPPEQFLTDQFNWSSLELSKVQIDKKQKSILFYRSQTRVSAFYLLAFARKNELFGDCPDIVLKPQVSLQEKAVQFFGFSSLYPDPATSFFESPDNLVSAKEHASYAVVDNSLLIRIEKSQEHNKTFFSQLYLFGYNSKIPFAQMPKIKVITKYNKYRIFNGKKLLKDTTGVSLLFNPEEIILKLPLSLLGSPDFIFSFVRAYKGNLPAEASGFKKIVIK